MQNNNNVEKTNSEKSESIVGMVLEGTITNITSFGAFVLIESGESGLVHISEIANEYITDVSQFVKIGEKVKVKVLALNNKNKYELSIKQVNEQDVKDKPPVVIRKKVNNNFEDKLSAFLKKSDEKQVDIRRNLKNKQGVSKKKR